MLTSFGIWRMLRAGDLVSLVSPRPASIVAAEEITGLTGPLERGSGGSNPAGADRQCGSVQLVRCCRQARQVAALRSVFNLALGLNCCLPELL